MRLFTDQKIHRMYGTVGEADTHDGPGKSTHAVDMRGRARAVLAEMVVSNEGRIHLVVSSQRYQLALLHHPKAVEH